jgi:methanethiol S-methyltransferase
VNVSPAGARAIAWTGAALFAGSLTYFLFTYIVTFGEITSGSLSPRALAADALLFGGFALHHSVFARERVRTWVARAFSPGLERSVYVWVASLMLIAVCAWWQPVPGAAWAVKGAARWILPLGQLLGVWLSVRSAAIIDVWDLSGVRQALTSNSQRLTPNSQRPTPNAQRPTGSIDTGRSGTNWELRVGSWEFKQEGPYGWIRHPIYLGWFLMVFPVATMTMTRLVFAVVSSAYILIAIPFEERSLRRAAGSAYEAYMKDVPWKLVPGVY